MDGPTHLPTSLDRLRQRVDLKTGTCHPIPRQSSGRSRMHKVHSTTTTTTTNLSSKLPFFVPFLFLHSFRFW